MRVAENVIPELHSRMRAERESSEKWHRIAAQLADALKAEVDLRRNLRGDGALVRSGSDYALSIARKEGLLP